MVTKNCESIDPATHWLTDLNQAARQVERTIRYQAICWWLSLVLLVIAVLVLLDCWLQRDDPGLRWLSLAIVAGVSLYAAKRLVLPIWKLRISSLDIAIWIERQHPHWSSRISTALQLAELEASDPRFGSRELRQVVLNQWNQQQDKPNCRGMIIRDGMFRAALGLSALAILSVIMLIGWPEMGARALQRLFTPWSATRWPTQDWLEFVNMPHAASLESIIQLEIQDRRPPLPRQISVLMRSRSNPDSTPTEIPAQILNGIAVAILPPLTQDIDLRAIGGDDRQMPWQTIRAIRPPAWKFSGFRVKPPEYILKSDEALQRLGKSTAAESTVDSFELLGPSIQALEGSSVQFFGELSVPVHHVGFTALTTDRAETTQSGVSTWNIVLEDNRTSVHTRSTSGDQWAKLEHTMLGRFEVALEPELTLLLPELCKVELLTDSPPTVQLPPSSLHSIAVGAPLRMEALVKDDWGLIEITGKLKLLSDPDQPLEIPLPLRQPNCLEQSIDELWDFYPELSNRRVSILPGDQLEFWLEARDLRGQTAISTVQLRSIATPQTQLEKIAAQQAPLARRFDELIRQQQVANQLLEALDQADSDQLVSQAQVDLATNLSQLQRSIADELIKADQNLPAQIDQLLDQLEDNRLSQSPVAQQLDSLAKKLQQLGEYTANEAAALAEQMQAEFERANLAESSANTTDGGTQLDKQQSEIIQSLESFRDQLARSQTTQRQREKLIQLAQQQEELRADTSRLNLVDRETFPEHSGRVEQTATRQATIAKELEQWLSVVLQNSEQDELQSPSSSKLKLRQSAELLVNQQTVSTMRKSSQNLQKSDLGSASQNQQQIQLSMDAALQLLDAAGTGQSDSSMQTADDQPNRQAQSQQQVERLAVDLEQMILQQQLLLPLYQQVADSLESNKTEVVADDDQLSQLVDQQSSIRDQVSRTASRVESMIAFHWLLRQVHQELTRAVAAAERQRISPDAIAAAVAGLEKLKIAAISLKSSAEEVKQSNSGTNQPIPSSEQSQESRTGSAISLASLKLIRALQSDLKDKLERSLKLTDLDRRQAMIDVARQQAELTDLLDKMLNSDAESVSRSSSATEAESSKLKPSTNPTSDPR